VRTLTDVTVLDLLWDGPHPLEEVSKFNSSPDFGIYQIYGTHSVIGPDTLLYIGKAETNSFCQRIPAHKDWIDWEPGTTSVYLGRLSGMDQMTAERDPVWREMISRAESLLIYFCTPPYNSYNIKTLPTYPPTIVLNYRRHHRLPLMVSNIYETTPVWEEHFKPYGRQG
jgi:hypothetical protein